MGQGTVIVGGSVAGIGAATELRRLDYAEPITVLDAQPMPPYDRPPLSKAVLTGDSDLDAITFHPGEHYDGLGITIRTSTRAVGLDTARRRVLLAGGDHVSGDAVIIATGARARAFPVDDPHCHVWTLRELEDAYGLREALRDARRVAVIGGGFIGAEVASSAHGLGLDVVVIEAAPLPFAGLLGTEVATLLAGLHHAAGTELRCGAAVERVDRVGSGRRITLAGGDTVDADIVVAGLGAVPNVEWLEASGLVLDGAVVCDHEGRTAAKGIYAAGDVATWHDPRTGAAHRHEHWTSAREQSRIVAERIAGVGDTAWQDSVPYVWSDQYGKRIQILGRPSGTDTVKLVDHDAGGGAFVAVYGRAGRLVAAAGCGRAGKTMRYRPKIEAGAAFDLA